jgi:cation:H+ antiporter
MLLAQLGFAGSLDNFILLLGAFTLLLLGAEIFTNGVEWFGRRLHISESATGSVLAAVGTALPETMIPVIAILQAQFFGGSQAAADEVGVGAILGAPFMLATIAMFLIGVSLLYFGDRRSFGPEFHFEAQATQRDLSFFLVGYTLAFAAAIIRQELIATAIAISLVLLYLVYLYRTLKSGELVDGDLDSLHLGDIAKEGIGPIPGLQMNPHDLGEDPPLSLVLLQTLLALGLIIAGAHLFVTEVEYFSEEVLNMPAALISLLLAPLATELPEKFNSVIWISRDKDTLAIGNITGAMAFQGTLPVTLGILFTSWNLTLEWGTGGFLNAFSAILAIISAAILYVRARSTGQGNMRPVPFLIGGIFYALFIAVVVWHVLVLDLTAVGGH